MFKQVQQLQEKMKELQSELAQKTTEASSGGGMVTVKVNGKQEILKVTIDPEMIKQNDLSMLQDLIVAATNEAIRQSQDMLQSEISKLTGGFRIPGLF